jgi:hypothetical protein
MRRTFSLFALCILLLVAAAGASFAGGAEVSGVTGDQATETIIGCGQYWKGSLAAKKYLIIEARLDYKCPAGALSSMKVTINDRVLTFPLKNKSGTFHFADGRTFPYYDPQTQSWAVFYSNDFTANNGESGKGYQVTTDPGEAYLYRWNISRLAGKGTFRLKIANSNPTSSLVCRAWVQDQ